MRRKLLIPTLTSLTLAPTIAMVGCGELEPEYDTKIELNWVEGSNADHYESEKFDLIEGKSYKLYVVKSKIDSSLDPYFVIVDSMGGVLSNLNVEVKEVIVGGEKTNYVFQPAWGWAIDFEFNLNDNINIYIKSNTTMLNVYCRTF